MKVKSESEVAQSCLTFSDPMDCSLPGPSVHGIFQARVLESGAIAFSIVLALPSYSGFHFYRALTSRSRDLIVQLTFFYLFQLICLVPWVLVTACRIFNLCGHMWRLWLQPENF